MPLTANDDLAAEILRVYESWGERWREYNRVEAARLARLLAAEEPVRRNVDDCCHDKSDPAVD